MTANIKIYRVTSTTGSPGYEDITSETNRAATSDDPNETTSNPIPVPSDGSTNYSYWVSTRLYAVSGPSTSITAIKWYTGGGTWDTGVALKVATASVYGPAKGSVGVNGSILNSANYGTGWDFASSVGVNAFTYTSANLLSITGSHGTAPNTFFGDFVVYQVEVISSASPGPTSSKTLTWQYDET